MPVYLHVVLTALSTLVVSCCCHRRCCCHCHHSLTTLKSVNWPFDMHGRPMALQEPFRFQSQIIVEVEASGFWTKQLLGFQSFWCEGNHCWLPRPCDISQSSKFPLKAYLLFEFCSSWGPWRTNWLTTQQNNTATGWHWGWTTHREALKNWEWQDPKRWEAYGSFINTKLYYHYNWQR